MDAISRDLALLLCITIQQGNKDKWYTFAGLTCWSCIRFSKGDLAKMCLSRQEGYRGCRLVNKRYNKVKSKPHPSPKT